MVQFNTLRLNGFKSFADRTEIEIGKGLTGIVGPNGCGKSNLVEALRWIMGETSSRRMRGGTTMEDVIFNGTSSRSSRNFSEVSLVLNNRGRSAPTTFNNSDEIEIIRRIERDKGSLYKVNGKTVRARDVQMLFADIVVGANSPALVSQGRVTQMITSKATERRKILEESAGIAGLYARRHEAELRLKSADTNLARLQDITGTQEAHLQNLQRQARQALKYKNLSTEIKKAEEIIACLEFSHAQSAYETGVHILQETENLVAAKMLTVTQLTKTHWTQSETLPDLREKTNRASAAWQVQNLTLERLEEEEKQTQETLSSLSQALKNLEQDQEHENSTRLENETLLTRLEHEEERHHTHQVDYKEILEKKDNEKEAQALKVQNLESRYKILIQESAEQEAQATALTRDIEKHMEQLNTCTHRIETLERESSHLQEQQATDDQQDSYTAEILTLKTKLEGLDKKERIFREQQSALNEEKEKIHVQQKEATQDLSACEAEIKTLTFFLEDFVEGDFSPVLDKIKAGKGLELALSRALGDTLQASLDQESAKRWQDSALDETSLPPLPSALKPLSDLVKAPKELDVALRMVGIAQTSQEAQKAFKDLKTGQSIVTPDGEYWRWDGYSMKEEAKDPQSEFLKQKNKLSELEKERPLKQELDLSLSVQEKNISDELSRISDSLETLYEERTLYKKNLKDKELQLKDNIEQTKENKEKLLKTKEALSFSLARQVELKEILDALESDKKILTNQLSNNETSKEDIEKFKNTLNQEQDVLNGLKIGYEQIQSDNKRRETRLHAIVDERLNLKNKLIRAAEQIKKFETRIEETQRKFEELKERPSQIKKEQETILNNITDLQAQKDEYQNTLNKAEEELRETNNALKEAESHLTTSKESRARAQATLENASNQLQSLQRTTEDTLSISIEKLFQIYKKEREENNYSLDEYKKKKDHLTLEREKIGPVNLRAEIEAEEVGSQLVDLLKERDEIVQAVEELRAGIEKLNTEARERLAEAFERINSYFKSLFVNLFGGGEAYLKLVDSEDPLDAGLEIYAQPPGKTLQSLSLLSGGEQTLTSIALIFAMFLTNPSPICVLDEIDAPLDDANVDRVCDLLEDIASRGNTRFLVITHHRLTMARMDRLYGVTMAERGISQLVSVDLEKQLSLLDVMEG